MDASSEIETINGLQDVADLKGRRSVKRGGITKAFKAFDKFYGQPLDEVNPADWGRKRDYMKMMLKVHQLITDRILLMLTFKEEAAEDADKPTFALAITEAERQNEIYDASIEDKEDKFHRFDQVLSLYTQGEDLSLRLERSKRKQDTGVYLSHSDMTKFEELVAAHHRLALAKGVVRTELEAQEHHISTLMGQLTLAPAATTTSTAGPAASSTSLHSYHKARNIELPEFHGDVLKWEPFWEVYTARMLEEKHTSVWELITATIKCLKSTEARELFTSASMGGRLKEGQDALLAEYGDKKRLYKVYTTKLTNTLAGSRYTDIHTSLTAFRRDYDDIIRGMNNTKGYSIQQLMGALAEKAMDRTLSKKWREHSSSSTSPPTIDEVLEFVGVRLKANADEHSLITDMLGGNRPRTAPAQVKNEPHHEKRHKAAMVHNQDSRSSSQRVESRICGYCGGNGHRIYVCDQFKKLNTEARKKAVIQKGVCFNCLAGGHSAASCRSTTTCKECNGRHHTLLHVHHSTPEAGTAARQTPPAADGSRNISHNNSAKDTQSKGSAASVIRAAPTARMIIRAGNRSLKGRALLDGGAMSSMVTSNLVKRLRAKQEAHSVLFETAGQGSIESAFTVQLSVGSADGQGDFVTVTPQVVEAICSPYPSYNYEPIKQDPWLTGKILADEGQGALSIDMLLSHTDYARCQRGAHLARPEKGLTYTNTIFGVVVGGDIPLLKSNVVSTIMLSDSKPSPVSRSVETKTDVILQQFWEREKMPGDEPQATDLEQVAIDHFRDTHSRDDHGRYYVSLPRVDDPPKLGESRPMAIQRYISNERSLKRKGQLDPFVAVLQEYLDLGHAELIPDNELQGKPQSTYYLPTHGVAKATSTTTKLRVVFDASASTTTGVSLNDLLLKGPNRYPRLSKIVNQFRSRRIAMSADISKMFREIGLHSEERDLHRFILRNKQGTLVDCRMKRLTFGVKSSPFLATEVLQQLAREYLTECPIAANAVMHNFYVDDCLVAVDSLEEAVATRSQLNELLTKGSMTLRKWRCNNSELVETIPEELRAEGNLVISTPSEECPRALGIHWDVVNDSMYIPTPTIEHKTEVTKREVISAVARTYDNLGWFAATTVAMKILMQEIWKAKVGWDEAIPTDLFLIWEKWRNQLPSVTEKHISRTLVQHCTEPVTTQLHGFCDASLKAYGAVIYIRTFHQDTTVSISLITSKSKVTPLSGHSTVPRLELCGAVLLSQLLHSAADELKVPIASTFAWSDSAVVLGWINSQQRFRAYVSRRADIIRSNIPAHQWRFVSTGCNPADLVSRGIMPEELTASQLWWHGPAWLKEDPSLWPRKPEINLDRELPEFKVALAAHPEQHSNGDQGRTSSLELSSHPLETYLNRYSSMSSLLRTTAWLLRIPWNARNKNNKRLSPRLTTQEMQEAEIHLQQQVQQLHYKATLDSLRKEKPLTKSDPLLPFNPLIGPDGLIRIGGRLENAPLDYMQQHPIILPHKSYLAKLTVKRVHYTSSHAGPSTMMAILAQTVYIKGAKRLAKSVTHQCVTCQRANARTGQQLMADLPAARVNQAPPFSVVGLDYAGPFIIRRGNPRKPTLVKAYACIFTCFLTKSVHFEAVTDLTSEAFLACLNRFVNRRGCPTHISSDNGTNFIGANRQLREAYAVLHKETTRLKLDHVCKEKGITWNFSPSRSPHHGGLWEAGVKAMKNILYKLLGSHGLTFEELQTLMTEAEATLNSRPLLHTDALPPDGLAPLTPGHFLIGRPLRSPPMVLDPASRQSPLKRWNYLKTLSADIWEQWQRRYLQQHQQRTKWRETQRNFRVNDLAVMREETLARRHWPIVRVVRTYPGKDGRVRVVDVRIPDPHFKGDPQQYRRSVLNRAITKLVLLVPASEDSADPVPPPPEDVQAPGRMPEQCKDTT